ncbi:hypothetical protein ACJ73_04795 [Blastomyces percursus]|uniref:Myb-like domain-containing protein n=1 Tax=Blastomyces percursus TaxID=1658174 RepID=A0A1J9Q570_9EURO|nr:hypothetical protein ACJ73_04795 [Blastomyces percursus]
MAPPRTLFFLLTRPIGSLPTADHAGAAVAFALHGGTCRAVLIPSGGCLSRPAAKHLCCEACLLSGSPLVPSSRKSAGRGETSPPTGHAYRMGFFFPLSTTGGKRAGEACRPMRRGRVRRTDVRVEIPSPPDALQVREGRGDSSDPSDFNHSSDCSGDDDDDDEAYWESDDDDHVARRPCKRRKLWTRRSSRSVVTSAACTGDPSRVSTVSLDDVVTNRSGDDIPVSGFLSSYVTGSKVCYTITFCHEETGRLLSANANGLSSPGREGRPSVATGIRVPFTSEDDALLKKLKEDGEPWDEIAKRFPRRSKATLQVRYSTKLKHRTPPPTRKSKSKSKSRPRKHGCR